MKKKELPAQVLSLQNFKNSHIGKEEATFWICSTKKYSLEYGAKKGKCSECGKRIFFLDDKKKNKKVKMICPECAYETHYGFLSESNKKLLKIIVLDNQQGDK